MRALVTTLTVVVLAWLASGCGCESKQKKLRDITLDKRGTKEEIQKLAEREGVSGLRAALEQYEDDRSRMAAINALGTFKKDPEAAKILLGLVDSKNENDVYFAIQALARTGAPEAKAVLEKAVDHASPHIRAGTVIAIGLYGDKSLHPLVIKALDDEVSEVQTAAVFARDRFGIEE